MDDILSIGDKIYMIDSYNITEFEVIEVYYDFSDKQKKVRILSENLSFSMTYNMASALIKDKDKAYAQLTKEIFDHINLTLSTTTHNMFNNYYELEDAVKKYSETNPEIFI